MGTSFIMELLNLMNKYFNDSKTQDASPSYAPDMFAHITDMHNELNFLDIVSAKMSTHIQSDA